MNKNINLILLGLILLIQIFDKQDNFLFLQLISLALIVINTVFYLYRKRIKSNETS